MSFTTTHGAESSSSSYSPQSCRRFTLIEIQLATQNFDESLVIGRGGFGKVYWGRFTDGERVLDAAIKRLEPGSSQGSVEFWAEVEMLSKLRHCHLVSLIGYCSDGQEMILIYEYMPHGTLADRLHKSRASLTWVRRLKICLGAARGFDYLHTGTGIKHGVIHRDIKSSNILLDDNWAARISDFGLSKIVPINQPTTYVNTLVRGTFGYLDPDYFQTGRLTRMSDVYAFGVIMFEVLSGKQAVDRSIDEEQWVLATWAQDSLKEGRLKQIIDPDLSGRISPKCLKEFAVLADRCLHSRPKQRPTMAAVVAGLESILTLQEKIDQTLFIKLFDRRLLTSLFQSNQENSVGIESLKSLDIYLYTIGGEDRIIHRFDFSTILQATEYFSESNKLSSGSYTFMYKGRLQNEQDITITNYSNAIICKNEASLLIKFEHENVIQLLGYCIDGTDTYLIYDFAVNTTLDHLLFDPMCNLLDWNKRYTIILGVARALVYLHRYAPVRMIHGDVKPANIVLDKSFNPKLSSFWLATTFDKTECSDVNSDQGTSGYTTPEYITTSQADIFSFGVLILETVTGQKAYDITRKDTMIADYVEKNWLEGRLADIIDPRINSVDPILMTKLTEIGLLCVQRDPEVRPTMEEVVDMLVGTVSPDPHVVKMAATRMYVKFLNDRRPRIFIDYDTSAVGDFIKELCPR